MKRPRLQLAILCDDVAKRTDGSLIIVSPTREISTYALPALYQSRLVTLWVDGQGTFRQRAKLASTLGAVVDEFPPVEIELNSPEAGCWAVQSIYLQFDNSGIHRLQLWLEGDLVADYPLLVKHIEPPTAEITEEALIKVSDEAPVYRIEGGKRRHIPDPETFAAMGLRWKDVQFVSRKQLDSIPLGEPYPTQHHARR